MLWGAAIEGGCCSPYWMTIKQATTFGAKVSKGERANLIVYASTFTKSEEGENGQEEERRMTGTVPARHVSDRRPRKKISGSRIWSVSWPARTAHWPKPHHCLFCEKRRRRSGRGVGRTHDQHPTSPSRSYSDQRGRHCWSAAHQSLCRA